MAREKPNPAAEAAGDDAVVRSWRRAPAAVEEPSGDDPAAAASGARTARAHFPGVSRAVGLPLPGSPGLSFGPRGVRRALLAALLLAVLAALGSPRLAAADREPMGSTPRR